MCRGLNFTTAAELLTVCLSISISLFHICVLSRRGQRAVCVCVSVSPRACAHKRVFSSRACFTPAFHLDRIADLKANIIW